MANDRKPIDVPEADAHEDERPWAPEEHLDENPRVEIDVPEADALDQARVIALDEEEEEAQPRNG
jgi:hypothetical protein